MNPFEQDITHHTESLPDGVRFILPRRPKGHGPAGGCLIVFGLLFSGVAVLIMLGALGVLDPIFNAMTNSVMPTSPPPMPTPNPATPKANPGPEAEDEGPEAPATGPEVPAPDPNTSTPPQPPIRPAPSTGFDFEGLCFAVFCIPFVLVGLVPITFGILTLFGHTEITIAGTQITVVDRAGPIFIRRKRDITTLEKLDVGFNYAAMTSSKAKSQSMSQGHAIHAQFTGASALQIAWGYPLATLRKLATEFVREHQRITKAAQPIEVRDTSRNPDAPADSSAILGVDANVLPEAIPAQPEQSLVIVERVTSGVTVRVPPAGFIKPAMGPIIFACFWLGIVGLITLVSFASGEFFALCFLTPFWLIGLGVGLLGYNMTRKQAVIDIVHDTLFVTSKGLFGTKQHEWRAADLSDIRVDHSGMSVNKKPILNLQIIPLSGNKLGLFTGRSEDELYWLAALLRVELGLRRKE